MSDENFNLSKPARVAISVVAAVLFPLVIAAAAHLVLLLMSALADFAQWLNWQYVVIGGMAIVIAVFAIAFGVSVYRALDVEPKQHEVPTPDTPRPK